MANEEQRAELGKEFTEKLNDIVNTIKNLELEESVVIDRSDQRDIYDSETVDPTKTNYFCYENDDAGKQYDYRQFSKIMQNLNRAKELAEYCSAPYTESGTLHKVQNGRYQLQNSRKFTSRSCVEALIGNPEFYLDGCTQNCSWMEGVIEYSGEIIFFLKCPIFRLQLFRFE